MNDEIVPGEVLSETIEGPDAEVINMFQKELGIDGELADEVEVPKPESHSVLQVWRDVLAPARTEASKRPNPQWCTRITQSYREIDFKDMLAYRDAYYGKLEELYQILLDEIATDDECLNYKEPAEDREHNSPHYLNLLFDWQKCVLGWELAWSCADVNAAVDLAAISEVYKMFFEDKGIVPFLESIQFEFEDSDKQRLANELEAMKEANGE